MFDRDKWQEIFATIRKNKLRTFLTAFSVGWGIFILIVLLGAGNGLRNGISAQFAGDASNTLWIEAGMTSMPYKGYKPGREILMTNDDYEGVRRRVQSIDYGTAVYGRRETRNMNYKKEKGSYTARPVLPEHQYLENCKMVAGRFINEKDIREFRKVCVIGIPVREALFKTEDPMGKLINIDGIAFQVVGVFTDLNQYDNTRAYIPLSTAQRAYNAKNTITTMWLGTGSSGTERSEAMVGEIRNLLAKYHSFDPQDQNAVFIWNNAIEYQRFMNLMNGIRLFIWMIGIMTLIAGVVGVSNIMMIVVKERTREIGVRKAIGATPSSIVFLIIQESVFITAVAGYAGLVFGLGILVAAKAFGVNSEFFRDPEVNVGVALSATVLIVFAGALAGFFPALKAARIQPVEALRAD